MTPATPPPGSRLVIVPDGWPTTLAKCPPGFFVFEGNLFLKSEYTTYDKHDAYCESGEYFWGGAKTTEERAALIVQPCHAEWVNDD